jgi:hypothetical protein
MFDRSGAIVNMHGWSIFFYVRRENNIDHI